MARIFASIPTRPEVIAGLNEKIAEIDDHLNHLIDYTIAWYRMIKGKYGKNFPRKTVIRSFEDIDAAKVAVATKTVCKPRGRIHWNDVEKDEFVCECSDIDDVIVFFYDGNTRW